MLGGDVALAHLHGFAQAVFQHALHAGRERQVARDVGVLVDGHHLADALHHSVVADVQALKRLGGQAVLFLDKAEQDMLGAHIGLMEGASFVLG